MKSLELACLIISLVVLASTLVNLFNPNVRVNLKNLARQLAYEVESTKGFKVINIGVPVIVVLNNSELEVIYKDYSAEVRINASKLIIPSYCVGSTIIIYSNDTHIWLANKLKVRTSSYIFSVSFVNIGFENITIQGDYAKCYLTIPKGTQVVQVKEHIPTDKEHEGIWSALRTYYPSSSYRTIWRWSINYASNYIWIEDNYLWRYGYYLAYPKKVFNGTIKIKFKCKYGRVYLFILNPRAVKEAEEKGWSFNGVYESKCIGYSSWDWKPTFNITVNHDKPFMVGISSYKYWYSTFCFRIKDVYIYYNKTVEVHEVNANIVGIKNLGNIPVKVRLKLVGGQGLEKLILKLNDTEQIVVGGSVIKSEGSWINLKPNQVLIINLYARSSKDSQEFYYKVVVECISSVARKELELVIKNC